MVHFIWMINTLLDKGENEIEGQDIEGESERGGKRKKKYAASSGTANFAKSTNIKYFVIKQVRGSYHLKYVIRDT